MKKNFIQLNAVKKLFLKKNCLQRLFFGYQHEAHGLMARKKTVPRHEGSFLYKAYSLKVFKDKINCYGDCFCFLVILVCFFNVFLSEPWRPLPKGLGLTLPKKCNMLEISQRIQFRFSFRKNGVEYEEKKQISSSVSDLPLLYPSSAYEI